MTIKFENLAPVLDLSSRRAEPRPSHHFVEFYEEDGDLLESLTRYALTGLRANEPVIAVLTAKHARALEDELVRTGVDFDESRRVGLLKVLDAEEALGLFMNGDVPDQAAFTEHFGDLIGAAGEGGRTVRVFGEMVAVLWERGNVPAALQLEDLWNELAKTHSFRLFCAYETSSFSGTNHGPIRAVCQRHTHVLAGSDATV